MEKNKTKPENELNLRQVKTQEKKEHTLKMTVHK